MPRVAFLAATRSVYKHDGLLVGHCDQAVCCPAVKQEEGMLSTTARMVMSLSVASNGKVDDQGSKKCFLSVPS